MKKNLHPELHLVKFVCSCGNSNELLSAIKSPEMRLEVCSKCHPFYTGEQRVLKTGSVDKFYARLQKTQQIKKS